MKICIFGAGSIGGYLGARLAHAGEQVTLIARGANLAAIRERGVTLIETDGTMLVAHPALATDDPSVAGAHDVVIVAVKAHQLPAVAPMLRPLFHDETIVVPAQNGIPWWYFQRHGGPFEGRRIESVDPDGIIAANIETERIIGCVVYPATELEAPGVVRHIEGDRFTLGELDGSRSERVQRLSQILTRAGLKAPVRPRIRTDIWIKLWGNLAFNPVSALTRATLIEICRHPQARALIVAMMEEGQAVAERLGITFGITIDQRIAGAEQVGAHKTSMLQDIEAGRATEVDALVGAVAELGRLVDVPTPHIDAIYAAVKLLEHTVTRATPPRSA
ncbi:MAG: 2-dehydropantoate 2-reductase [Roseiflexaceae bacterium]|nr:2-dehydropantoate 2-reductase [Roseiflexus sp.]MDW8213388.1 2-dehydropantoate 2-reductase [Roseiflexaceae bacterium]